MLDDLFPGLDMGSVPRIAGVPRFLYRHGMQQLVKYLSMLARGSALDVLVEELRVLKFVGLFSECWKRGIVKPRLEHAVASRPFVARSLPHHLVRSAWKPSKGKRVP
jgi:hypothetical protein